MKRTDDEGGAGWLCLFCGGVIARKPLRVSVGWTDDGVEDEQWFAAHRECFVEQTSGAGALFGVDFDLSEPTRPPTRVVRQIIVRDKALADDLCSQLRAGADFETLARRYSRERGEGENGSPLTAYEGFSVEPWGETAFALDTGEISEPIETAFGWHVIQALAPVENPG